MAMPLEGIKIIDLTNSYSGPIGTMQLADYGAEVIKVEPPKRGDFSRAWEPSVDGCNINFPAFNRNKKSVTLNLKTEEGKKIFFKLVENADVVVENYRGGTIEKLGITYDVLKQVNSQIIVASLSGYGQTGPYKTRGCYAMLAEAMSGVMSMTGSPNGTPYVSGVAFGDSVAGMFTALGIMFALFYRERTGKGQYIDVAMLDSLIALSEGMMGETDLLEDDVTRIGNRDSAGYPYDSFEAKDGYCILTVSDVTDWSNFAKACELEHLIDDPRFDTNKKRWDNADELHELISEWTRKHTKEEISKRFNEYKQGYAPILSISEMMKNEQVLAREMVLEVPDKNFGTILEAGFPIKMSETQPEIRKAAPLLGEDNKSIYSELGYSAEQIETYEAAGII